MDNVVCFYYNTAEFKLLYPNAILKLPLSNLKKIITLMFSDELSHRNSEAIEMTFHTICDYVEQTKAQWEKTSIAYQNGYVDTKYHYCADKKKASANNNKLMKAVKSAKHQHERAQKLLNYFNETSKKYSYH